MKLAAAAAIAGLVAEEDLNEYNIMPQPFDPRVSDVVSAAVKAYINK
jgi:malate dehydrogenase (oxaloacetate-decarboxylating)